MPGVLASAVVVVVTGTRPTSATIVPGVLASAVVVVVTGTRTVPVVTVSREPVVSRCAVVRAAETDVMRTG